MTATTYQALSLKQPWATLLAHGRKTIEIRTWITRHRGPLLIHAAGIPDERPEAWARVPQELLAEARINGGLVGAGRLHAIKVYRDAATFAAECDRHFNDPAWYQPNLIGFCFDQLRPMPFRKCPGYIRIFELAFDDLEIPPPPPEEPGVIASALRRVRRIIQAVRGERQP